MSKIILLRALKKTQSSFMELEFSFFSLLLTFLVFVFTVLKIGKRFKTNETTLSLTTRAMEITSHRKPAPACWLSAPSSTKRLVQAIRALDAPTTRTSFNCCCYFTGIRQRSNENSRCYFASRPHFLASEIVAYGSTNIIFSLYGDYWRQLQKICISELLSTKRVQSFRSVREEEVSNLINWIASKEGSPINFTEKIHSLAFGVTSRAAFGKKRNDQEIFIAVVKEATKLAAGFDFADLFPSIEAIQWISGTKYQKLTESLKTSSRNIRKTKRH
ncbi:hypothetical protein ACOSQ2_030476 [Xanthoceras sorbifolium]